MFEPGQKVVCINDVFPVGIRDFYNALPRAGKTYTVRDIVPGQDWKLNGQPAVYLVELENRPNEHGIEPGFACHRFAEAEEIEERERAYAGAGGDEEGESWKT
jgi:hypothetical protein